MATGNFVRAVQRVADDNGVLLPAQRAVRVRAPLLVTDVPETASGSTLAGSFGAEGEITGYTELALGNGSLGSSLSIGQAGAPQYFTQVSSTLTLYTGTAAAGSVAIPVGKAVAIELLVTAEMVLPTPGIVLPGLLAQSFVYASGSSAIGLAWSAYDAARTSTGSPWIYSAVSLGISGRNVVATASAYSVPAWAPTTAYGGALAPGTSLPDAIGDTTNSLVTNGSNIYVCMVGGTSAGSGGPSGTSGAITDGTCTWRYVGPAAAGVPLTLTVFLNARMG